MPGARVSCSQWANRFVAGVAAVAVVIAGADGERGVAAQEGEVFFHHADLRVDVERGGEVEEVAADDDEIAAAGMGDDPVVLLEREMEIGEEEEFHAREEFHTEARRARRFLG